MMLEALLFIAFLLCFLVQAGIGNKKELKGYLHNLWVKIILPLFQYHFVLTERKLLIFYFKTMSGLFALSFAVTLTVHTKIFDLGINYDGGKIEYYTVILAVAISAIYALWMILNYMSKTRGKGKVNRNVVFQANEVSHELVIKNEKSKKYIPETYLEVDDYKDRLRYFCDPVCFFNLIQERALKVNFDYVDYRRRQKGKAPFPYNPPTASPKEINLANVSERSAAAFSYFAKLSEKRLDYIENCKGFTFRMLSLQYESLTKKICLIKGEPGCGKTNLLCDFVDKTLSERQIPALFVNAFQLNANDIAGSLSKAMYSFDTIDFVYILMGMKGYCHKHNKPFVIIIDGLNENLKAKEFSTNLLTFLEQIKKFDFVRIVLTCRTKYFKENFENQLKSLSDETFTIENLYSRLNDNQKRRILHNYFTYFDISYATMSEDAEEKLTENFLLLRIFSEANQGQNVGTINNLYKARLFKTYYDIMCQRIANNMKEFQQLSPVSIKSLFQKIISLMISTKTFMNVPLDDVLTHCNQQEKDAYLRFLDENILLRKDLLEDNVFATREVVNFTYDEFRDFLLAEYLKEISKSVQSSELGQTITELTNEAIVTFEGLRTFLFLVGHNDPALNKILVSQPWYENAFVSCIWSIPDEEISDDDIMHLKQMFPLYIKYLTRMFVLINWDLSVNPRLNITILLDILSELDLDGIMKIFNVSFDYYTRRYEGMTEQKYLLKILLNRVMSKKLTSSPIRYRSLMCFVLYIASFNDEAKKIILEYDKIYHNEPLLRDIQKKTKCKELNYFIEKHLLLHS